MFTATVTGTDADGQRQLHGRRGFDLELRRGEPGRGSGNSRTAACTTTTLAVATHSITAKYSGDANNATSTSAVISETITGTPAALVPKVAFTLSNTLLIAPQTVTITATATETGGTIAKVSLYLNGAKLADLTDVAVHVHHRRRWRPARTMFYATATDLAGHRDVDADAERRGDLRSAAGGTHGRQHLAPAQPGDVRRLAGRSGEGAEHGHPGLDRQPVRCSRCRAIRTRSTT